MTKAADLRLRRSLADISPATFGAGSVVQRAAKAIFGRAKPRLAGARQTSPLDATAAECRQLVTQRALVAAGVAMVPIAGLDIVADVALLSKLLGNINQKFELTETQIEALQPAKRVATFKAIGAVGNHLIGKVVTQALVVHLLKTVGVRMTTKQVTKYVPLAGQAISAALAFSAMRHVCMRHIDDCMRVRQSLTIEARP